MGKRFIKGKAYLIMGIIIAVLMILTTLLFISVITAKSSGTSIGSGIGEKVGAAQGSFKAVSQASELFNEGKNIGLSAEDTEINNIKERLLSTGKLQVLVAGVSIESNTTVGEKYAALYITEGNAVFTVDLNKIDIKYDKANNKLVVKIPEPQVDVKLDHGKDKLLAEFQKKFTWGNDAKEGSTARINTVNKLDDTPQDVIGNYETLHNTAKTNAENQIKELIGSLSFTDNIEVSFAGGV